MFSNYSFQIILLGTSILGFLAGAIGVFSTLRKQALIGDSLSHAAFPGIVIAFIIFDTKNMTVLLLGAIVAAVVSMILMQLIKKYTKVKFDASMALILSAFFGLGNVLLNSITGASQAGLGNFIFGQAATMLRSDVVLIAIVAAVVLLLVAVFWRHIKVYIFNEDFYRSLGFNKTIISALLSAVTVLVVVVSIRVIGVVLMSALLIAPAVAARQLSNRFGVNFFIAGVIGMIAGAIGTIASYQVEGLPTGPAIVVFLSIIVIIALLFSPRGIVISQIKKSQQKKRLEKYHLLIHLFEEKEHDHLKEANYQRFIEKGYLTNEKLLTEKGIRMVTNIMRGD